MVTHNGKSDLPLARPSAGKYKNEFSEKKNKNSLPLYSRHYIVELVCDVHSHSLFFTYSIVEACAHISMDFNPAALLLCDGFAGSCDSTLQ